MINFNFNIFYEWYINSQNNSLFFDTINPIPYKYYKLKDDKNRMGCP